ncbi:MAG: hypothetical protein AB1649_25525 [Chloroflexota bacterium]
MNKTLSTILIVIAVLALAGGIFFAGSMYARANVYGPSMMYGWNNNNYADGPGIMNGRGGYGMMGGGRGYGMMGGYDWYSGTNSNVTPLTVDQAKAAAEKYIQSLNLTGLETGEVMIFDNHAYVIVKESDTGLGAFELLVDPVSQIAYPEYGPNMMWNLKYGYLGHGSMMGGRGGFGMMGGWNYQTVPSADVSAELTVTPKQAVEHAQQYLDANYAGATAANDPTQFYGYYTIDFSKDGSIVGMLSVNSYNGQVFLHTWHGTFIEEAE